MNLGQSIRQNSLWVLTGRVSGQFIGFAVGIVLARLLVPEDFGLIVTINVFTGVLGYIAAGGMSEALVQAKQVSNDDYRIVFTVQLLICLTIYICLYYFALLIAAWFKNPLYIDLLRVAALSFMIRPFIGPARAKLKREMRFKIITLSSLTGIIVGSSTSIMLAIMQMGPWALILGGLAGSILNTTILMLYARWIPGIRFQWSIVRRLGSFGAKMTLNEVVIHLRKQTSNLIISHQLGPAQLGLYNKASSLSEMPSMTIGGSAYATVFRALSKEQENLDRSKYIYFRTIQLVSVYTFPLYIGLIWLSEPFIVTVYGQKWIDSGLPLQILAFVGFFRTISIVSGAVIAAQNRLGYELLIQAENWILLVIGCVLGLNWGIVGVAYGVLPSIIHLSLRLAQLANQQLKAGFPDLIRSLKPALLLSTALIIILTITDLLLPDSLQSDQPGFYILAMGSAGGLCYSLLFLFAPIPALATESLRWKKRLRLVAE